MIDIHNHSLYGVDDGAKSIEISVEMLRVAKNQGIHAMILTPHYRHGMFDYPLEDIEDHFERLKRRAAEIGIKIYLGCEYHVNSTMLEAFQSGRCRTLADGDYVLTEYSYETEYSYIVQNTKQLLSNGYIPVIAHVERYRCFFCAPERCGELRQLGAIIQMNVDSVLGLEGWNTKRFCKKVLKNNWADVIASDAHGISERANHLGKCCKYVEKKYGRPYAMRLFCDNPGKIISNGNDRED